MYRLIIVDDEPITREYIKLNIPLLNSKWQVAFEASEGQEALKILEKTSLPVDAVITDIKMPVMDGLELCKELHKKYPNIKTIILSGYDEFTYAKEAIKYNVSEYILKPIVKEELSAALNKITAQIEERNNKNITYKSITNLLKDSKEQITRDFLKAAITDSSVEIKALTPIIFKLKINIIESEAAILILSVDEEKILQNSFQLSEINIFKFILLQLSEKIALINNFLLCLDEQGNTVILVTGENKNDIEDKCKSFYNNASSKFYDSTGITITGGMGIPICDEQQLKISYINSLKAQSCKLFKYGNNFFTLDDYNTLSEDFSNLNKLINNIKSSLLDKNDVSFSISLINFIKTLDCFSVDSILIYGIFMIKCISKLNNNFTEENAENALKILGTFCKNHISNLNKESVKKTFNYIIKYSFNSTLINTKKFNDNDLIDKAKNYIYIHYKEPISLALIAEKINVSSSYLSNIFHKNEGESYIKFLTKVRMEQAKKMLKTYPPYKIYDVAEMVGYINVKHFSYLFKKYNNISPGEYQENHLKITQNMD